MVILFQAVDEYPQLFAYGNPADVPNMMVVGGIGIDGDLWRRSKVDPPNQGNVIKVYAPCYDITVPDAQTGGYREPTTVQGVSYGTHTFYSPRSWSWLNRDILADFCYTSFGHDRWTGRILLRTFKSRRLSSRR